MGLFSKLFRKNRKNKTHTTASEIKDTGGSTSRSDDVLCSSESKRDSCSGLQASVSRTLMIYDKKSSIAITHGNLSVRVRREKQIFDASTIVSVIYTVIDNTPFHVESFVTITLEDNGTIYEICVDEGHPNFKKFMFEQLPELIDMDFNAFIKAIMCIDGDFVLYRRDALNTHQSDTVLNDTDESESAES